ncbi:hypothetical protein D3C81_2031920 [compost metagenome]
MRPIVTDVIQQGVDRIRDQLGAVFTEPFGWQDLRFERMFGLQPAHNLLGDKRPRTVAL